MRSSGTVGVPWVEVSDCWMKLKLDLKESPGPGSLGWAGPGWRPGVSWRSQKGLSWDLDGGLAAPQPS